MNIQPVVKWTGSKRSQAEEIIRQFPPYRRYYEPFLGGGSVLFAAAPQQATAGDICAPLIELWRIVQKEPDKILSYYTKCWIRLQEQGHTVYYEIRDQFNDTEDPLALFFLTRTCVNGLIRFNQHGRFNNSLHHTRKGINPKRLRTILYEWSHRLRNVNFVAADYRETTLEATSDDFVYLDPPYFHTKGRYYGAIDYEEFMEYLNQLNERGIRFALSFDGSRGEKDYDVPLPASLYSRQLVLASGNSSFKKVQERKSEQVYESLYLNF